MPSKYFLEEIDIFYRVVEGYANVMQSRCKGLSCERGDLLAWGMVGLLSALREFDPDNAKGASLRTYVSRRVSWSMMDGVNQWRRSSAEPGSGTGFIEDESIPEPAEEPGQEREFLRSRIAEAVETLPGDLRELVNLHFYEGYTISEIARSRGLSHQRIADRVQSAIFELQTELLCKGEHMKCGSDVHAIKSGVSKTTARPPICPGCGQEIGRGEPCILVGGLGYTPKKYHTVCLRKVAEALQEFADMRQREQYGNEGRILLQTE